MAPSKQRTTTEARQAAAAQEVRGLSARDLLAILNTELPPATRGARSNERLQHEAAPAELERRLLGFDKLTAEIKKLKETITGLKGEKTELQQQHEAALAELNKQLEDMGAKLREGDELNKQLSKLLDRLRESRELDRVLFVNTLYTVNRITGLTLLDIKNVQYSAKYKGSNDESDDGLLLSFMIGKFIVDIDPATYEVTISSEQLGIGKVAFHTDQSGAFPRVQFLAMKSIFAEDPELELSRRLPDEVAAEVYTSERALPPAQRTSPPLTLPGGTTPDRDRQVIEAP